MEDLRKQGWCTWVITPEASPGMRVPGVIFASDAMISQVLSDKSVDQVVNVAKLPGIVGASIAMPDVHRGYGFPIGGVAAFDIEKGVISPGGVGYDINCGVRVLKTSLTLKEVQPRLPQIVEAVFEAVPSGVGSSGSVKLTPDQLKEVVLKGAEWAVNERGFGTQQDLVRTEENGKMAGADPEVISQRALKRGSAQLGTLGSGNHFLEIGVVEEVFLPEAAKAMGLELNQVVVSVHTGSRGFGHQVADDYIKIMKKSMSRFGISVPDVQLACAPFDSPEGKRYFSAMVAAANYAWANRQIITHRIRESFEKVFRIKSQELGLELVYDVAHNIAKIEEHEVDGRKKKLVVHRKGATRAFGPGSPVLPPKYKEIGQPVLIPGDMGRYSYILVGSQGSMQKSFGSACHGAGRLLSRTKASRMATPSSVKRSLMDRGILVKAHTDATLTEEISEAYKDVSQVVDVVERADLAKAVLRIRPVAVIKG